MTAPGGKTVPSPVDNLKLPRIFSEYTECCYHLPDTCFERSTPRSRRSLKYSIFNIYTCFDVIFPHHYTCHSSLYNFSDNKERNISCKYIITILITTMVYIERNHVVFPKTALFYIILLLCRVLHTMFSHLRAHAFARSVTVARSSSVQASSLHNNSNITSMAHPRRPELRSATKQNQ